MDKQISASGVARPDGVQPREASLRRGDGAAGPCAKPRGPLGLALAGAVLGALWAAAPSAPAADDRFARPAPNVQRQVDRLERGGSVDPLTRRRLEDQLRREPRGPERSAAERGLERLPEAAPAPSGPLPAPPAPDSLPSSLPRGFGGSGGGPGTSGYMVPPGGR